MDGSRQEYPALLTSLRPSQAVDVLSDRVEVIKKINIDIADWLQERRRVEEAYVAGLRKLARRPQQDGAALLGIFQTPWQRIIGGTENLAQSHETLAQQIERDVETPLRQFATKNREMQSMSTMQGNIVSIAKDFDNAQKKADKRKDKSSSKAANAASNIDEVTQLWENQAPYVFEQLQALDETRVNHLRDVLTQFQTHEVDQVERNRLSAESCLNALLNLETADEIKVFAATVASGRASIPRRQSSSLRPSSSMGPPAPPPPRMTDGGASLRTTSSTGQDRLAALQEETPHKSKLGGIKRLGTVIGRRRDKAPPPTPEKKKERSSRASFVPFRRGDSSRNFQDLEQSGADLSPAVSRDVPRIATPSFDTAGSFANTTNERLSTAPLVNGSSGPEASEIPSIAALPNSVETQQRQTALPQELSAAPSSPAVAPPSLSDAVTRAQQEAASSSAETEEASRNLKIRDQPIPEDETEAQKAMSSMANQLRMQAQTSGISRIQSTVRGRRDVRNTVFIPNAPEAPIPNSVSEYSTPIAAVGVGAAGVGTAAAAAMAAGSGDIEDIVSPIKRSETSGVPKEELPASTPSDANSIHSSHSLAGLAHHPDLFEPGVNASIIETVNTWFVNGGVTKSFVVGEIAMNYNPLSATESEAKTETIRLSNFHVLEKVAANPTFVTELVGKNVKDGQESAQADHSGEYTVLLSAIRRPTPTVGLKYQLHLDPANLSAFSPVLLTPAWQVEEAQVSVIILYSANPAFGSTTPGELVLRNVVISVSLDTNHPGSGRATNAMMSPTVGASFKRKQGLVVWRMPELAITPGEQSGKLLVRFLITGGMVKEGGVEAKWELDGEVGSSLGVSVISETTAHEESDPFADGEDVVAVGGVDGNWKQVNTKKKLISGRYSAS